ncbi:MAG: MFS transporter [Lachnospiraceae bacterium]|nr:MFS transporter [Clostridiales bacterium]MBR6849597.1 MFS transporter [Lachnospiraceae bacterium]
MNNEIENTKKNPLRDFYVLWSTQSLSHLGSSISAFALTLWLYDKTGSTLGTAALTICTYAPYVIMSIFAGALTDRFNKKKTMLVCDTLAALCTVTVLLLYMTDTLSVWHLYAVNIFSGLMNTVQQPASEVTMTLIVPKAYYQKISAMNSLTRSLNSILHPLIATALYGLVGMNVVFALDLLTFATAFVALLGFVRIPEKPSEKKESTITLAKEGLQFLKKTPLVFSLILFMSGVNLVASAFDATLYGYVIPNPKGGKGVLGIVTACSGIAMVIGSLIVSKMPKPKDRVRVVYVTMLISLSVENYVLAFSREPVLWCLGQIVGWILVPVMSANLDVVLRNIIPVELQGRVYACRNTFQFFTIPIGLFLGGLMVDHVCEPFMARHAYSEVLTILFGSGKGSGAALMMGILGLSGTIHCLVFGARLKKYHYSDS